MGAYMRCSAAVNQVAFASVGMWSVDGRSDAVAGNTTIRVGRMNQWQREAVAKVLKFAYSLRQNWDSYGSAPIRTWVVDAAIELIREVPFDNLSAPRVVPVSGGGIQFEWSKGNRDLEIEVRPDRSIEGLKVLSGMPVDEGQELTSSTDIEQLFSWLIAG